MIFEITHTDLKQALKDYLVKNEFIKPTTDFDFQVKTSRRGERATRTIIETKYPRLDQPVLVQGKLDFEQVAEERIAKFFELDQPIQQEFVFNTPLIDAKYEPSTEPLEDDPEEVDISTSTEVIEEPVEAIEQPESTSRTPFKKLFG